MSGLKDIHLTLFFRSIWSRGLTACMIADTIHCGRAHLSQVLNGRRSGKPTWRKIIKSGLLTVDELKLLDKRSTWKAQEDKIPRCSCGAERPANAGYCVECRRSKQRIYRFLHPLKGEARRRANARSYLHVYVKRGKVVKGLCADCGSAEVEAHHHDYSKPLDVTWLCRPCHLARHGIVAASPRAKIHMPNHQQEVA